MKALVIFDIQSVRADTDSLDQYAVMSAVILSVVLPGSEGESRPPSAKPLSVLSRNGL